ncbi:hypothetical protein KP509_13G072400 [Ceratopteris richardii]|uniref:BRCT domain-containing protein n=1 Tax=Ceratopteris richardii TaxID=49495 RepID=A0A8T2TGI7_CERRI|nr:hypothetical protein KP509_13G072400 [Ceratopteris richardii]
MNESSKGSISRQKRTNIASVRAASLHASGLRAAARATSNSASKETHFSCSTPEIESAHLSYVNSLDPGEDSQLYAFAIVDRLVDSSAELMTKTSESSKVLEKPYTKSSQIFNGLQSLAQDANIKDRHGELGIYDWIDSQSGDDDKDLSVSGISGKWQVCKKGGKQCCKTSKLGRVAVNDSRSDFFISKVDCLRKQGNLNNQQESAVSMEVISAGTSSINAESKEGNTVENGLCDLDVDQYTEEQIDIGANTQIALEAMDIMRHSTAACDKQKQDFVPMFNIGNDTQVALDAFDILRHGVDSNLSSPNGKSLAKEVPEHHDLVDDVMMNTIDDSSEANAVSLPVLKARKRTLPSRYRKSKGNKSFHRGLLKAPNKATVANVKERVLFDFSSAMVPRRKRSRLCSPRVSTKENVEAFEWERSDDLLCKTHVESKKLNIGQETSGMLCQDQIVKDVACTESTNRKLCKRVKREEPVELDPCNLLDHGRKKRRCEPKTVFVLFSHSLSKDTVNQQKKILARLGGHATDSAAKATHFVVDAFTRSKNMLEIMAAGKMVVTSNWLEGCSQAQYFVEEESYILKDFQKEKEWGFCMQSSLASSRRKPLLKGMQIALSPNTVPEFSAMKAIIESAGGQVLQKLSISKPYKPDIIALITFIIASEDDYDFCAEYIKAGVVHAFIFCSLLFF